MKLSAKRKSDLYAAIEGNIMDARIEIEKSTKYNMGCDTDEILSKLMFDIWPEVKKTLNFDD